MRIKEKLFNKNKTKIIQIDNNAQNIHLTNVLCYTADKLNLVGIPNLVLALKDNIKGIQLTY